jgi:nitrogen fixation/metabolism regulation signal transduction histidine kinase
MSSKLELDPIEEFWFQTFMKDITPLERYQFERVTKFLSLNDPMTFILAYMIHDTFASTQASINDLLRAGSTAQRFAKELAGDFIKLHNAVDKLMAVQREIQYQIKDGSSVLYEANAALKAFEQNRSKLRTIISAFVGGTAIIAIMCGALGAIIAMKLAS